MHTFGYNGTIFIHNGDYSGDVEIVNGKQRLTVPADAILEFVADHVRRKKIAKLEDSDRNEILGIDGD